MLDETMKLVLGWTIVTLFVATGGLTLASLVGWVKFVYPKQQQGLYASLILEIVVGTVGGAAGAARLDAGAVAEEVRSEGRQAEILDQVEEGLASAVAGASLAERADLLRLVDRLEVKPNTVQEERKAELRASIERLPEGRITPQAAETIRRSEAFTDARNFRRLAPSQ